MVTFEAFTSVDLIFGAITKAEDFPKAINPS